MRLAVPSLLVVLAVAGCGSSGATNTRKATSTATATPAARATAVPTRYVAPKPRPTPTPVVGQAYAAFVRTICTAFAARDANTITNSLPYYQYNSGLRYGSLGDGEGQSADPALMRTWLAGRHVRCTNYTPDLAGHGVVLSRGWSVNGYQWGLLDLDTFQGHWKINDFTFGLYPDLWFAMHSSLPILHYSG